MRHRSSVILKPSAEVDLDMQNMTKRGNVYYVRFIVPKERWSDVGVATGACNGTRRDITKSLETRITGKLFADVMRLSLSFEKRQTRL
ncbi:MAG: hypothetical protein GX413_02030 [Acetobacter sp.]|nr:hypothetical protein [Acetobacter sp.]